MPDSSKIVEIASIPNLTKTRWSQRLVETVRLHLWVGDIPASYPVSSHENKQLPYSDIQLKSIKTVYDFSKITQQSGLWQDYEPVSAPKPATKYDLDHDAFAELVRRIGDFRTRISDQSRSGAVLSVLFTELDWPVHFVVKMLGISRPTISRWIFVHQNDPITEEELQAFHDCFVNDSRFTYLFDLRTVAFRSKRTGLTFKKATFLPNENLIFLMRALWRVAYRVRGEKSDRHSQECSKTFDMTIELLLRRGVTAQNIGRVLGIQHMAIIQRSRKSVDCYGAIEQTMNKFDSARVDEYTVTSQRINSDDDDDFEMPAILLQARTALPTKSHPIPPSNVFVLCGKNSPSNLSDLEKFDSMPSYAFPSYVDDLPGRYSTAMPNLYSRNQHALVEYNLSSNPKLHSMSPLVNASIGILGFDGLRYSSSRPDKWTSGKMLSEYLLLQATMNFDRDRYFHGFDAVTYHWIPGEITDIISIIPCASSDDIEAIRDSETPNRELEDFEFNSLMDFFPAHHKNIITNWMTNSASPNKLLEECFKNPYGIISRFSAPAPRGVASA